MDQRLLKALSIGHGDTLILSLSYRAAMAVFEIIRLTRMLHELLRGSGTVVVQVTPKSIMPMLRLRNFANGNRLRVPPSAAQGRALYLASFRAETRVQISLSRGRYCLSPPQGIDI